MDYSGGGGGGGREGGRIKYGRRVNGRKGGETKQDEVHQPCGDREETRSNISHMEDYKFSRIIEQNGSFQYPSIWSLTF